MPTNPRRRPPERTSAGGTNRTTPTATMRAAPRFDVFLCYTSEQRPLVDAIRAKLDEAHLAVFVDQKDIPFSRSFDSVIRDGIESSSVMIFVLSAHAMNPESYALFEVTRAFNEWSRQGSASNRIITLRADDTPIPPLLRECPHLGQAEMDRRLVALVRRCRHHDPRIRDASIQKTFTVLGAAAALLVLGLLGVWALQRPVGLDHAPTPPPVESFMLDREPSRHLLSTTPTRAGPAGSPSAARESNVATIELTEGVSLTFVRVPAGRVTMGSSPGRPPSTLPEPIEHHVVPERWITTTEITRGAWTALMGSITRQCERGCSDEHPMTYVSYHDALAFANALSDRLGHERCYEPRNGEWLERTPCEGMRLLSEVEWEHAARGGSPRLYSFGDDATLLCQYGNGRDQSRAHRSKPDRPALSCNDGYGGLAPVASFRPNAYGLHDMHGNVWEWVTGPAPGGRGQRLLRGGSYLDAAEGLRAAKRYQFGRDRRYPSVGFRCAIDRRPALHETAPTTEDPP